MGRRVMLRWVEFRRRNNSSCERQGSLSRSCAKRLSRFLQFKQADEEENCCLRLGPQSFQSGDKIISLTLGVLDQIRYRLGLHDAKIATT